MSKNKFVFVVCGAKEHIDALNYSLKTLKKFSASDIIVITDSARNSEIIRHDHIIDVKTPVNLNHHQASIFIKTGIYGYLPANYRYCYLDTDVIALNSGVDEIFNLFSAPVTFAPDHCRLSGFSPAAVNCGCYEQFGLWQKELKHLIEEQKKHERIPEHPEKKKRLKEKFERLEKNTDPFYIFRYWLSPRKFRLDDEFVLDKKTRVWYDKEGNTVNYDLPNIHPEIEDFTDYRYRANNGKSAWTIHGREVFDCKCDHLGKHIEKEFGIGIADPEWRHWNGGVFLFEDQSKDFLKAWHEKTMRIFEIKEWKTRDQGTLAATAWEFGLQNHRTLPSAFNLIADYENKKIIYHGGLEFSAEGSQEPISPHFIHVYHHWGDAQWDVWKDVEAKTGISLEPEREYFNALWVGSAVSKLELLTIRSFLRHGHTFRLWVYDKIKTPLPEGTLLADANEIIPREKVFNYKRSNAYGHGKGSYAGFSDIFRYKLLFERGGWWTDMDITCLKHIHTDKPYFFRPHHDMMVVGNVMKCPKGSELMRLCYEKAVQSVDENNTDWHKPIQILNDYVAQIGLQPYISKKISNDDRWEETSKFIWKKDELPQDWCFIHWQNEEWRAQDVDKTDFYHRSALAFLLNQHELFRFPASGRQRALNEVRHHVLMRTFLKVLNWFEGPVS